MAHSQTVASQPDAGQADTGKLLRSVLSENALFSCASGVFLIIAGSAIDRWLGVNQWLLIAAGVGLCFYAVFLWQGARGTRLREMGWIAVVGDAGWILGAVVIVVATGWFTRNGERALMLLNLPIGFFAIGQLVGLRRMSAPS